MLNYGFGFANWILLLYELSHVAMAIDNDMIGMLVNVKSNEEITGPS